MKISEILTEAASRLDGAGIPEPRKEASSLLLNVLNRDLTFLVAHPEYELTASESSLYRSFIERRSNREPFQYIVGHQEFFGLEFVVSPGVLIPRPETEILVEAAIELLRAMVDPSFCEIGVGSGCISVSILHEVKNARGFGVDISQKALAVARRNAEKHNVLDRLDLIESDVFSRLTGKFGLIVSNPPYVPIEDIPTLQPEVVNFEPRLALDGGEGGLDLVERIISLAPEHLGPHGVLLMEIGFGQSERVRELFDPLIWELPLFLPDQQGIPRIARAQLVC